ncbi:hypothetical protein Esi_0281_0015 [Ectocarpus siliculosus]|uniref:Uncharacterized protein n=1 Tax=Ectocarpus siliculosus TaxID=2880 RepID=D8LK65_ECTSI|nr:hypothetical protein Esi_0281_0015 [Ectocarpus siliculosus]|eukprot:CBN76029.1 hypothetical protein Esi_0281_0015 [Ectocarpus siliculosus]
MEPPSTPQRSVLGSRRAPTPSSSTKKGRATRSKRRSSGQAARAVVDNQPPESSSDTTKVFWVSLGNPTYKFCVFREAVRGLTGPKLARMLDDIMTSLYQAHSDKNFDVIGTVCDGAAEHRSFQKYLAEIAFSEWARGDSAFEKRMGDFKVAFKHPSHGGPVFNMSDPVHLLKKVVNALWHSDIPSKQRDLKKLWYNEAAEDYEWVSFSLKTLEKVWKEEEAGGGVRSVAEQAAHLIRFLKFDPEMFTRNSHNCMSVGLSAKRNGEAGGQQPTAIWRNRDLC